MILFFNFQIMMKDRKHLPATLLLTAFCVMGLSSCVDEAYDFEKLDHTYAVNRASKKLTWDIRVSVDRIFQETPREIDENGDFTLALPAISGGFYFGSALFEEYRYAVGSDWFSKEIAITFTISSSIPYPLTATVIPVEGHETEYDFTVEDADTIKVSPSTISLSPGKETKMKLTFTSPQETNFFAFRLNLVTTEPVVTLNQQQEIVTKDVLIEYPNGATVRE